MRVTRRAGGMGELDEGRGVHTEEITQIGLAWKKITESGGWGDIFPESTQQNFHRFIY